MMISKVVLSVLFIALAGSANACTEKDTETVLTCMEPDAKFPDFVVHVVKNCKGEVAYKPHHILCDNIKIIASNNVVIEFVCISTFQANKEVVGVVETIEISKITGAYVRYMQMQSTPDKKTSGTCSVMQPKLKF